MHLHNVSAGGVISALTFAVFSFVSFESSATLAQEARNPMRAIPRAVTLSATVTGLFFVLIAYCMVLGVGDQVHFIGDSSSPFTEVTVRAGLGRIAADTTPLNAFSYTATFGTFGFVLVYLLTCIVAPVELGRAKELSLGKLIAGALGTALMLFVLIGTMVPVPSYPMSLLPYLFGAYLTLGILWYGIVSVRFPHALSGIALDLEK